MNGVYKVEAIDHGLSLSYFLKKSVAPLLSMKAIKKIIEGKCCYVNARLEVFAARTLMHGDVVELKAQELLAMPSSCSMIFEDDHLLIVDKLPGVVSSDQAIAKALGGRAFYSLIHRLDKETSGVLMIAKDEACHKKMKALFQQKMVQKYYLAIVSGSVAKKMGEIDNFLAATSAPEGQVRFGEKSTGQRAITQWRVLQKGQTASLLLLMPVTGRTHQLRVHMSGMDHPILGDHLYGKATNQNTMAARIMLHAFAVRFIHPFSKKEIFISASIPEDFKKALMSEGIKLLGDNRSILSLLNKG